MKVLLLTSEKYTKCYSEFYVGLHKRIGSMDRRSLGEESKKLRIYFSNYINTNKYDRIVIHLEFKVIQPQIRFLKLLENVIFLDTSIYLKNEDESLDILSHLKFFKKMPWSRIVITSYQVMDLFQEEGLDAWMISKGYDSEWYSDKESSRHIPLTLTRDINNLSAEYEILEKQLKKHYPTLQVENHKVEPNSSRLSKTLTCICADLERGGYGRKVFQAMASGCLVISYNQGTDENFYHSFKDMDNIVLFHDLEGLLEKITILKKNPKLISEIAKSGKKLSHEHHQNAYLGNKFADYITPSLRKKNDYSIGVSVFGLEI